MFDCVLLSLNLHCCVDSYNEPHDHEFVVYGKVLVAENRYQYDEKFPDQLEIHLEKIKTEGKHNLIDR